MHQAPGHGKKQAGKRGELEATWRNQESKVRDDKQKQKSETATPKLLPGGKGATRTRRMERLEGGGEGKDRAWGKCAGVTPHVEQASAAEPPSTDVCMCACGDALEGSTKSPAVADSGVWGR